MLQETFAGHFDVASNHSHLIINNVTLDMHGKYRCWVKTDLNDFENELDVTVITKSPCTMDDWRITSHPGGCYEKVIFECRHMFPRPRAMCGPYDARTGKIISGVLLEIDEDSPLADTKQKTYRVTYANQMELTNPDGSPSVQWGHLLGYAGHLVFKCDIYVPGTSWRLSMSRKMFDFADGCEEDPLEAIGRMRQQYNQYVRGRLQQGHSNLTTMTNKANLQHHHHQNQHGQHLQTVADRHSLASTFNFEVLLPSEVRKLTRRNKYGGLGEMDMDATTGLSPSTKTSASLKAVGADSSRPHYVSEDYNCWKKPRIGTIVKLSCAEGNESPMRRFNYHQPPRLMGSNLLECRANGWNLVRESHLINNELLDRKVYKVRVSKRRKQVGSQLWPPKTASSTTRLPPPSTATTTNTTPVASNAIAESRPNDLNNQNWNRTNEENDIDDDDSARVDATTTRLPTTETENETIPNLGVSTDSSRSEHDDEAEDEAGLNNFVMNILDEARGKPRGELQPDQLADLLPSCVSVSPRRRNQKVASSDGRHSGIAHGFVEPTIGSSSGSSIPATTITTSNFQAIQVVIVCVALLVAALFQMPVVRLEAF